jgi:hypothetical protein
MHGNLFQQEKEKKNLHILMNNKKEYFSSFRASECLFVGSIEAE